MSNWLEPKTAEEVSKDVLGDVKASSVTTDDWQDMVVQAFGYKDLPGQLRAIYLMGECTKSMWKSSINAVKKVAKKEIDEGVEKLSRWGTIPPSDAAIKDVIIKVLQSKKIYPYPELVAGIFENPYGSKANKSGGGLQERGLGPETTWPISERKSS